MNQSANDNSTIEPEKIARIIGAIKLLAKEYRQCTGKPLGITGEIGEYEAAKHLGLNLATARTPGYDAVDKGGTKFQIKTRCVRQDSKPGQRVGGIKLKHDWDCVALVLLNSEFEPYEIHVADRARIVEELSRPGSKARTVRGQLGVRKFKMIGRCVWTNSN